MKLILLFKILLIIIFINSAPVQIKYFSTILLYFSLLLAQGFYFLEFLIQLLQFGVGDVLLLFLLLHLQLLFFIVQMFFDFRSFFQQIRVAQLL